jgi:hypothetical protein
MIELELIDGYFEDDAFYIRSIAGFAMEGRYKSHGLRSLARLIDDNEPFSFTIGKDTFVHVPVEINAKLKRELMMIADELDRRQRPL